jgi:hypothetical protein
MLHPPDFIVSKLSHEDGIDGVKMAHKFNLFGGKLVIREELSYD